MTAVLASPFVERRRRAAELAERWPFAAEVLRVYSTIAAVQADAFEAARDDPPATLDAAPGWIAERVIPRVIAATVAVAPEPLVAEAQSLLYGGDAAGVVAAWLAEEELPPARAFLARAASAPVLEAAPGLLPPPLEPSPRRCPACGALPQVSIFTSSGEALVTGQRRLQCSRCAATWSYARMTCAGCGEDISSRLPILADHDAFPHLRVDACDTCRTYLISVDQAKEPSAVPLVDELAALPLDLAARERGLRKVTPNLVGM